MFKPHPDRFFEGGENFADREKKLEVARQTAIQEVLKMEGFEGIESLARNAEAANTVGMSLSKATGDEYLAQIIPRRFAEENWELDLARGYIWNRWYPGNWDWIDKQLENCSTVNQQAWLLAIVRFTPEAWTRAAKLGNETDALYWKRAGAWNPELDEDAVAIAVEKMIEHDRVGGTIGILGMAIHQKKNVASDVLFLPLEKLLTLSSGVLHKQFGQTTRYDIQKIIQELQSRDDFSEERLIRIEWNFLAMLDEHSGHSPKKLFAKLATSPEFFVEVLSYCFRSAFEADEERESDTEKQRKQQLATQSYRLLSDWNLIPGTTSDGSIDAKVLVSWCQKSRKLAAECGRSEVCDSQIGQLLALAPRNEDGSWPEAVCFAVEEIATDSLASGLNCGIRNSRKVTFRAKGGNQERQLQAKFRELAAQIRFRFPFLATVLDDVSEGYASESSRWDELEKWEQ